jgi:ABC-type Fe3+/spermidine/putrescine transport system ATPase subunit
MNKGHIEQTGSPEDIYQTPSSLFVARLLGGCNALPLDSTDGDVAVARGLKLRIRSERNLPSSRSHLCIRPGAVLVGAEADGCENGFAARLQSLTFLGDIVRLRLAPEQSPSAVIEAEVLRSRIDRMPSSGEVVRFALPEKHIMLLTDNA